MLKIDQLKSNTANYLKKVFKSYDFYPILFLVILVLFLMGPLLLNGYILHFDFIVAPEIKFNIDAIEAGEQLPNTLAQNGIFWLMGLLIPIHMAQKIILIVILLFGLISNYFLTNKFSRLSRIFSSVIFAINPFTYDRFMAGHWAFLIGYMLLPAFIYSSIKLLNKPSIENLRKPLIFWTIASLFSPHFLVINLIIVLVISVYYLRSKTQLKYVSGLVFSTLLFSSWWLLILIFSNNTYSGLGSSEFIDFLTKSDYDYGQLVSLLSLQGFWFEGWESVRDFVVYWPMLLMIILTPVFVGVGVLLKENRKLVLTLFTLFIFSVVLSAGSSPIFYDINKFLFENIPGLNGFREPQKFIAILALVYSIFMLYGFDFIAKNYQKYKILLFSLFLLASLIMVRPWWWGANNQIQLSHYPESWNSLNNTLVGGEKVLILPWSLYINKSFAGEYVVSNPAQVYFAEKSVQSADPQYSNIADPTREEYLDIRMAIESQDIAKLKEQISQLNIKYILIVNSSDSISYDWVKNLEFTKRLELTDENSDILMVIDR